MTKLKLFPRRELTASQEPSIPQRRPYETFAEPHQYQSLPQQQRQHRHYPDDVTDGEANHAAEGLNSLSLGQSRSNTTDSITSPSADDAFSPIGTNCSHLDALSPASILTPSVSSATPSLAGYPHSQGRKRARTASHGDGGLRNEDGVRPRSDLLGLLNPVEETPTYSPRLRIADLDNPIHPAPQPFSQDVRPFYRSGMSAGHRFAEIKPRPHGQRSDQSPATAKAMLENDEVRRKGRKGPLESDQRRAEVLEVREMGACMRCHIMRIRCEAVKDGPCKNCRDTLPKSRKWTVPCTREWLKDRSRYLVPAMHQKRHDPEQFPHFPPEILGEPYGLELEHFTGFKFKIDVCEARVPVEQKSIFVKLTYHQAGKDVNARKTLVEDSCLPLVPAGMRPGKESHDQAVKITENLLLRQISNLSQEWVHKVFPDGKGQEWARKVLYLVVHFQLEVYPSAAFRSPAAKAALQSCLTRVLMTYPFYIAPHKMDEVNCMLSPEYRLPYAELRRKWDNDEIQSPKVVNRWLKSALLRVLTDSLQKLFSELEAVFNLQENGGDGAKLSSLDRDEAFCAIAMTLIVIGTTQASLVQNGIAWDREVPGSKGELEAEAKECVQHMETEVVDHLLQLWKYRFCKQRMAGQPSADRVETADKAANFNVIQMFLKSRDDYESSLVGIKPDLNFDNIDRFRTHNETRLLLKFSNAIWKPKSGHR